jgi:CRISPR-associated protein Csb2
VSKYLLIAVRLHEGRYHGEGEAEPSPARLFQALIAGAARGQGVAAHRPSFEWLEGLAPPVLALPRTSAGQQLGSYVPNNDLDAKGGDPARVSEIRVLKTIRPRLFDAAVPFLYAWEFDEQEEERAREVCAIADGLYQFGRGVDLAWAVAEILDREALEQRLSGHPGRVLRPSGPGNSDDIPCPQPGSFESLEVRHAASLERLTTSAADPSRQFLRQPPKPRFRQVAYGATTTWRVFELRHGEGLARLAAEECHGLVTAVRDAAVLRLKKALPGHTEKVEAVLVGRRADGTGAGPTAARVRILPLPSIGHAEADQRVRRVLVEVPGQCPLSPADVFWAFSGLELQWGTQPLVLTGSWEDSMARHYRTASRTWRTVTPMALPPTAARRRIEPSRSDREAKGGQERLAEEHRAAAAVLQALRHAEVRAGVESIRVQREPFSRRGTRAERFGDGVRFNKERLWHVEVTFTSRVQGPLSLGDGRFVGLGLLHPERRELGVHAFAVEEGLAATVDPQGLARALRRAVMARVQWQLGSQRELSPYFSGHSPGGAPATTPHLCYLFDPDGRRLMVLAPHLLGGSEPGFEERRNLETLACAMEGFTELRAGRSGHLKLRAVPVDVETDPLFAPARVWQSVTPYQVTRHLKRVGAKDALVGNILQECRERGLPEPAIRASGTHGIAGTGLVGAAQLTFKVAVPGPILLGRSYHLGGGVFRGQQGQ